LWGFAVVIRSPRFNILFDTGSNGRVLLKNMSALGYSPQDMDMLFLSHPHWDHIGGLDSVLELNPEMTVVVHEGFSKHLISDLRNQCAELVVVGTEPISLGQDIHSSGMLQSDAAEQALILQCGDCAAVISGCAHPGMDQLVRRARDIIGRRIDYAIGGFHLMYANARGIKHTIAELQALGVQHVVPTHCTGDTAREAFRLAYGKHFMEGGVGRRILLD
jgi:7,8-dihydropterin-6-yl-methyl-4-(beta-D-ribofuranosyl)aminobenzene 5'-phosphate synthase